MGFEQESLPEIEGSESPNYRSRSVRESGGQKLGSIDRRNLDTAHFGDEMESTI